MKFDDDLKASFIDRLLSHGNASRAATECGIASGTAYSYRVDDPAFARDWDAALDETADPLGLSGGTLAVAKSIATILVAAHEVYLTALDR